MHVGQRFDIGLYSLEQYSAADFSSNPPPPKLRPGVIAGRDLWDLFAHQLDVVSRPEVPVPLIAALVIGALLVANGAALVYARDARRLRTAELLRSQG